MSAPFDYASLRDNNVAETARTTARDILNSFNRNDRHIGNQLRIVKDAMPHGQFGHWIAAELQITIRTAQRYIQVAILLDGKSDTVSHLPPAVINALANAQTSADLIKRVVEADERGTPMSVKEIREALAEERSKRRVERHNQWLERQAARKKAARADHAQKPKVARTARQVTG